MSSVLLKPPRARSEHEAREVLESVKSRFYTTHANQIAENQDKQNGRSTRDGKKQRYSAYIAKAFGKTGKIWPYLGTAVMPEKASYPWHDEWTYPGRVPNYGTSPRLAVLDSLQFKKVR